MRVLVVFNNSFHVPCFLSLIVLHFSSLAPEVLGGRYSVAQRYSAPPVTIDYSRVQSANDCHPECNGCHEPKSAVSCFTCKHFTQSLRNRAGFKCVAHCDPGYYIEEDKCRACSSNCKSCTKSEKCDTCLGAKLLIDVDHYGHMDHGQCVDECPPELEVDYSYALQARCILKKNKCFPGYYEQLNGVCTNCHEACETCHGPGPLQCDSCAPNYSNLSVGYCRPCCKPNENPSDFHCENCLLSAQKAAAKRRYGQSSAVGSFAIFVFTIALFSSIFIVVYKICQRTGHGFHHSNIQYSPLPVYGSNKQELDVDIDSRSGSEADESENQLIDVNVPPREPML